MPDELAGCDRRPGAGVSADVVVGLDLGTSGLKAVALDGTGTVLARAHRSYPTRRDHAGAAEQDPADWWSATVGAVAALAAAVPAQRWLGLGLSAMIPTLVLLDDAGAPLGPAVTWQDARADAEGERFRETAGSGSLYRRTGQWVDGHYLVPMFQALRQREPTRARAAATLGGAKDYLFARLTGQLLTDPSTATGFGCYDLATGQWDDGLAAGVPALPALAPSSSHRPLSPDAAAELRLPAGLPVVLGGADSVLGAYGVGARSAGDVAYIAGTSTVILGRRDDAALDVEHRYLLTPMADGGYGAEMDLLATGSAYDWLAGLLGLTCAADIAALAGTVDPDTAPTFMPYLARGEQGALWDPTLTGGMVGITLAHGRAEIARALQTGVVLESVRCLGVLGAGTVRISGPAGPGLAADLADASACPVRVDVGATDHSAVGAALLAGLALDHGSHELVTETRLVEPRPDRHDLWQRLFETHERARAAVGAQGTTR